MTVGGGCLWSVASIGSVRRPSVRDLGGPAAPFGDESVAVGVGLGETCSAVRRGRR